MWLHTIMSTLDNLSLYHFIILFIIICQWRHNCSKDTPTERHWCVWHAELIVAQRECTKSNQVGVDRKMSEPICVHVLQIALADSVGVRRIRHFMIAWCKADISDSFVQKILDHICPEKFSSQVCSLLAGTFLHMPTILKHFMVWAWKQNLFPELHFCGREIWEKLWEKLFNFSFVLSSTVRLAHMAPSQT